MVCSSNCMNVGDVDGTLEGTCVGYLVGFPLTRNDGDVEGTEVEVS